MLAITLSLGVWQIERLHWKEVLLAEIDRAEAAPPVALPPAPSPFEKVEVEGQFRADLAAHYGSEVRSTAEGPQLGSQLLMPLVRPGQPPILVDRGWLPDDAKVPASTAPVTVVGYVRPPEAPGRLSPSPDLSARRFWSLDPAQIGAALGLPRIAPFTLVALGPADASPMPAQALPRPPNDHLGYAITWFGLAACLIGVFTTYVKKAVRP